MAKGFRDDAFSYLLFLRLVPVFPFFLVNLVPAFAGVRLGPFVAATAIGVIPAVVVFTMAGMGLDSVMTAQKNVYYQCMASGGQPCRMVFEPADVLTPQMIMALIGLHLYLVVRLGVTSPPWSSTAAGRERPEAESGPRQGLIREPSGEGGES